MRAIILAAGSGTRLQPITDEIPKCLVELGGISILKRQINVLRTAGIDDITVVAGYRADQIDFPEVKKIINPDYATTNMVATLFCAEKTMTGGSDLLITYGDIVYEMKVLDKLLQCPESVCITFDRNWKAYWQMRMANVLDDAETLKLDSENRILELGKKPKSVQEIEGQYMGLIKVNALLIENFIDAYRSMDQTCLYDGKVFSEMYMTSFLQYLIDSNWHVQGVPVHGGWLEIDSVQDINTYEDLYEKQQLYRLMPSVDLQYRTATVGG